MGGTSLAHFAILIFTLDSRVCDLKKEKLRVFLLCEGKKN
jgi:hypothetical protein